MRTLAIECSTEACSAALFDGDALLANDHRLLGRGHAEHLVPMIAALPGNGRAGRVLVALGPGSFTGIRIGIATARALALVWSAQTFGYPTPALVAAMAREAHPGEAVDVAMTGGHGEWFVQHFTSQGVPARPAVSLSPDEAIATCRSELVAGTQADALVAGRGYGQPFACRPNAVASRALARKTLVEDLSPIYGRAPDARPLSQQVRAR